MAQLCLSFHHLVRRNPKRTVIASSNFILQVMQDQYCSFYSKSTATLELDLSETNKHDFHLQRSVGGSKRLDDVLFQERYYLARRTALHNHSKLSNVFISVYECVLNRFKCFSDHAPHLLK